MEKKIISHFATYKILLRKNQKNIWCS
jgi:hypothetical protein